MTQRGGPPKPISELVAAVEKARSLRPTPTQKRIVDAAEQIMGQQDTQAILYQHSALCQTFLPFRDPGDDARTWERANGHVRLELAAGKAMHPLTAEFVQVGLPFGPKARLVLMHINQLALVAKSPEFEVEQSLTRFVMRALKLDTNGRTIRTVKDQLARLSASRITLGIAKDGVARTVQTQIVSAFDIWFPQDDRQRLLWPSTLRLSAEYFESLKAHAVPLDEAAVSALSHSALALDLYAWLAQRLHRVGEGKPLLIVWPLLHMQFGPDYKSLTKFRQVFKVALRQVRAVYSAARIDVDGRGLTLRQSAPPVAPKILPLWGRR